MSTNKNIVSLWVSPSGDDANPGSSKSPIRTLHAAQDALRALLNKEDNTDYQVILREGTYPLSTSLELDEQDSPKPGRKVIWRGDDDASVRITGGANLDSWNAVSGEAIVQRLPENARDHVVECDLREAGIADFGNIDPRSGKKMELYFRGEFLELARYPNDDYLNIADVPQEGELQYEGGKPHLRNGIYAGRHYGRFIAPNDRMKGWETRDDMYIQGYWTWDWADSTGRVGRIDSETREIFPAEPYHRYGYTKGQRFYFLNILEELDSPGEWYADTASGKIYLWPPEAIGPGDVTVSISNVPLISLRDAARVTVSGIEFSCSRNSAISMESCTDVEINTCRFTNLGWHAITCDDGNRIRISGCELWNLASGGIKLGGGNRRTLVAGRCEIIDNHIHHFASRIKTYHFGIAIEGVGNRVANNEVDHASHTAIGWHGNDHIIELNEVHHVVTETNDAGSSYNGRDPSQQGTIIRHNYWHHIGGIAGHGTNSIYFDDALCGNTVYGNVFFQGGVPGKALMGAVFIHGGRYNRIENNMFIDCELAYGESPWSDETWEKYSVIHEWHQRLHVVVDIDKPPYTEKYPWIQNIMNDTRPNVLARNLVCRCKQFLGRGEQVLEDNLEVPELPDFALVTDGPDGKQLHIKTDMIECEAIPGFEPIPFRDIGRGRK